MTWQTVVLFAYNKIAFRATYFHIGPAFALPRNAFVTVKDTIEFNGDIIYYDGNTFSIGGNAFATVCNTFSN